MESPVRTKKLVPWIVTLVFFCVLNETVFNVSTPRIAAQFSLSPAGVSWMMTVFMVLFGIGSVIYGKLADIYSLRGLIVQGILLYAAGSLLGFLMRSSYGWVILARGIQGVGASALPALVTVAVARYVAPEERGRIFGLITSTVSLGIGIGPVLGGFVSGSLGWPYLFLVPLLTLVSIPFFQRELPAEKKRPGKVDVPGATLTALAVGALVAFVNFSRWETLAGCLALLAASLAWMARAAHPFIPPALFRNRPFRKAVIVGFTLFSTVIGVLFLVPLMLATVHGLDTSRIGLVLFPGAISSVFFGTLGGSLADRKGNPFVMHIGLVLLAASMLAMAALQGASSIAVAAALVPTYVGFSFFQTAMMNSVSQSLPDHETGVGMGVFNMLGTLSGAVGTALVGKLLAGGWLERKLLPLTGDFKAAAYTNVLLLFGAVVVAAGIYYIRGHASKRLAAPPLGEAAD